MTRARAVYKDTDDLYLLPRFLLLTDRGSPMAVSRSHKQLRYTDRADCWRGFGPETSRWGKLQR